LTFRRLRRGVFIAALIVVASPACASAAGGFSPPFTISRPIANDLIGVQLAFTSGNEVAAAFGIDNEDSSETSTGLLSVQPAGGRFGAPRTILDAQQVLALAYGANTLELLTGNSPAGDPCCSAVLAAPVTGEHVGNRHTLLDGLSGNTDAVLLGDHNRLVAALATEHGVWTAQTDPQGHWGPTRSLNIHRSWPQQLAATTLADGRTILVWTALASQFAPGPTSISLAAGDSGGAPSHPHITLGVAAGHTIDELRVAARGSTPTVAWIESWYDATGAFHSQAYAEDLGGARREQALSSPSQLASGLALASGPTGAEAVAFRTCGSDGTCVLHAALRRRRGFGPFSTLGAIDPTQTPVVAVGSTGGAAIGWIDAGSPVAATAALGAPSFGPPVTASETTYASNLTLAFNQAGTGGLVAWTQGTFNQSIIGARYTVL
jgi:hypothetical protein